MATAFKTKVEDSQVKGAIPEEYASKEQESPGTADNAASE
jgi:ubiquitin